MIPGADIVVVNYRTPRDLAAFCESYLEHRPGIPASLTIVNVDPTDEDEVVAGEWAGTLDAVVISFPTNVGYAHACNTAAVQGRHPVIALFNADIELTEGSIDACVGALLARPDWGVLGPRQVNRRGGRIVHGGIFGTRAAPDVRGWLLADRESYHDVRDDAVSVTGSAYFIKRSLWDDLTACEVYQRVAPGAEGAFLPTQHYYEETWCSYHAQAHGHRCVYFGPVSIVHRWHKASPHGSYVDRHVMPKSKAMFRAACAAHEIPCN